MFGPGDMAALKNEIRDSDLQALMVAVIKEEEEDDLDLKSPGSGAEEG